MRWVVQCKSIAGGECKRRVERWRDERDERVNLPNTSSSTKHLSAGLRMRAAHRLPELQAMRAHG